MNSFGPARRSFSTEENVASFVGVALFPLLAFLIVLLGRSWAWDYPELVLMALPAGFSLLAYLAARRLGTSTAFALKLVFVSGVVCFMAICAGGLLAGIASFLETF